MDIVNQVQILDKVVCISLFANALHWKFLTKVAWKNKISKVSDHTWGLPEGSLFNSYYTDV